MKGFEFSLPSFSANTMHFGLQVQPVNPQPESFPVNTQFVGSVVNDSPGTLQGFEDELLGIFRPGDRTSKVDVESHPIWSRLYRVDSSTDRRRVDP